MHKIILLLLKEVDNARVGPYHPISPKTPAVSNGFVFNLIAYNGWHKTIMQFIYTQTVSEKNILLNYSYNMDMNI